jgi:ubiquinone/menaquinone biosynthesis C-methylase UbiE
MDSKERAQQIFSSRSADVWSRLYERPQSLFEDSVRRRGAYVADFVARRFGPDASVLDLGCGAGVLAEQVLRDGKRVVAMDLSREMIARTYERIRSYPQQRRCVLRGDCEQLPFRDAQFDVAICLGVISFLADDARVLAELRRIVRAGGTLVLAVRNRDTLGRALDPVKLAGRIWRGMRPRAGGRVETPRFFEIRALVETLHRHGFEVFEEKRIGYGPLTLGGRSLMPLAAQIRLSNLVDRLASLPGLRWLSSGADLCVLSARAAEPPRGQAGGAVADSANRRGT